MLIKENKTYCALHEDRIGLIKDQYYIISYVASKHRNVLKLLFHNVFLFSVKNWVIIWF